MTRRSKRQAVQQQQQEQEEQEEQQQEQQQQLSQDSTAGITQEEIASLDPAELSNPDAVINGIRFGLTKISKLAEETIPYCASDDLKSSVADRLEACMVKLIKAETMYSKAASIVTDMVENMPEETNCDAATILRTCEQISDVSKKRIADFSESLTEEEIKSNKTYKHFVNNLQKLLRGEAADSDILDDDDDDENNEDDDDDDDEGQDEDDEEEGEDEDDEEEGGEGAEAEVEENEEEDEEDEEETEAPAAEAAEEVGGDDDEDDDDNEQEDNENEDEDEEEEEDDEDEEGPAAVQTEEAADEDADGDEDNDDDNEDGEEGGDQSGSGSEEEEDEEEEVAEPPQQTEEPEAEEEEEEEESEEEILEDEEQLLPTVDPITRQELKDPVRNQKCGHIYGKAAMAQLIKKNSKTRCPIAGCSNKEFIKLNQLVADRKLTMEIRKKQAEEKKQNRRR